MGLLRQLLYENLPSIIPDILIETFVQLLTENLILLMALTLIAMFVLFSIVYSIKYSLLNIIVAPTIQRISYPNVYSEYSTLFERIARWRWWPSLVNQSSIDKYKTNINLNSNTNFREKILLSEEPTEHRTDGQVIHRHWYKIPVDVLTAESTFFIELITQSNHFSLHQIKEKRSSFQLALMSTSEGVDILFTGPKDLLSEKNVQEEFGSSIELLENSNPLSIFLTDNQSYDLAGYTLYDRSPRGAFRPLFNTGHGLKSEQYSGFDEMINKMMSSSDNHIVVTTIRPMELPDQEDVIDWSDHTGYRYFKRFFDRRFDDLEENKNFYQVQLSEIKANVDPSDSGESVSEWVPRTQDDEPIHDSKYEHPIINSMSDLSSSKHDFTDQSHHPEFAANKIAFAQTNIRSRPIRKIIPGVDSKKRAFGVYEDDLKNFIQRKVEK